jgi:2-polyprenyl-3-methyl-5-hydroxy-6-metoxy-1,4-benzoquinol methylase
VKTEVDSPYSRDLAQFSIETGVSQANLISVLEIERRFHRQILLTTDAAVRRQMYAELYSTVHPLLRTERSGESAKCATSLVRLFRRELSGKSILDVGCGSGELLLAVHELIPHGTLCGLDTFSGQFPTSSAISFVQQDVIDFRMERSFEVVFSNQVLEHIAPADLNTHLTSIKRALAPSGRFILSMPNKYWGPCDVTRVIDNTYTGRTAAQGSHLNESSYAEVCSTLRRHGFRRLRTVLPFANVYPALGAFRLPPYLNRLLETRPLRKIVNLIRRNGRPLFRNSIILIASNR